MHIPKAGRLSEWRESRLAFGSQRLDAGESCVKLEPFPVVEPDHEPGPVRLLDRSGPPGLLSHTLAG